MKAISLFLFLWAIPSAFCQRTFMKSIDIRNLNEQSTCIIKWGDAMAIYLADVCFQEHTFCDEIMKIDKDGAVIWRRNLQSTDSIGNIGKYALATMGENLLVGLTGDSPGEHLYIDLRLISPDGDSLWSMKIKRNAKLILRSLALTEDNKIICAVNWINPNNIWDTFIIKLDTSGHIYWEKHYIGSKGQLHFVPLSVYPLPHNEVLAYHKFCSLVDDCFYKNKQLRRLDSLGNTIWIRNFEGNHRHGFENCLKLNNGNYVIDYKKDEYEQDPRKTLDGPECIRAISPEGDSLWEVRFYTRFDSNGLERETELTTFSIRLAKNGDILGCGYRFLVNKDHGEACWIFRISQEGKVLWQRLIQYGLTPSNRSNLEILWDIAEDSDGNIWCSGEVYDTIPGMPSNPRWTYDVLLCKLSPDGCLLKACGPDLKVQHASDLRNATEEIRFDSKPAAKIIPNPVFDRMNIVPNGSHRIKAWALYDVTGNRLKVRCLHTSEHLELDLSPLAAGMYYISLEFFDHTKQVSKIIKQ